MIMRRVLMFAAIVSCVASSALSQWTQPTPPNGPIYYNGGNVGIGTPSPVQKLDVNGGNISLSSGNSIYLHSSSDPNWTFGKDNAHNINVRGFGSQNRAFQVIDTLNEAARFTVNFASGNVGVFGNLALVSGNSIYLHASNDPNWTFGKDAANNINVRGYGNQNRAFQVIDDSTGSDVVRFSVNLLTGDVTSTGNLAAKYQDVAEWVPASSSLAPGTVVIIGSDHDNEVLPSQRAYDTRVAGVVSPNPGVLLGVAGDAKEKIAAAGRVKVRVDATRAPIRRGDLLVTSDKPGMAMKSEPVSVGGVLMHRPGTVVGKALEPLASGQGEILVLLSLQ